MEFSRKKRCVEMGEQLGTGFGGRRQNNIQCLIFWTSNKELGRDQIIEGLGVRQESLVFIDSAIAMTSSGKSKTYLGMPKIERNVKKEEERKDQKKKKNLKCWEQPPSDYCD